jgi:hypothetical protein
MPNADPRPPTPVPAIEKNPARILCAPGSLK